MAKEIWIRWLLNYFSIRDFKNHESSVNYSKDQWYSILKDRLAGYVNNYHLPYLFAHSASQTSVKQNILEFRGCSYEEWGQVCHMLLWQRNGYMYKRCPWLLVWPSMGGKTVFGFSWELGLREDWVWIPGLPGLPTSWLLQLDPCRY